MSFFETPRFPDCIALGAHGGPTYFTELVTVASGFEQRNEVWQYARCKWDVGHVARPETDMWQLISFYRAMRGRLHGFRFKDWSDFQADAGGAGVIGTGLGTGLPDTMQLFKRYTPGASPYDLRIIQKPVDGTITVTRNAVDAPTGWTLDTTTGLITFTATATAVVSAITNANPGVATTSSPHGFSNGESIYLSSVEGMTQVNNRAFVIAGVTASTFQLGENTTSYGTFTGTTFAERYTQPGETLAWSGEFDVPCRFDTDDMQISIVDRQGGEEGKLLAAWESIPIIEIRIS
jgi:uncharacterized protein (TIGR02217 family)